MKDTRGCRRVNVENKVAAVALVMCACVLATSFCGCGISVTNPMVLDVPNSGRELGGMLSGQSVILMPPQMLFVRTENEAPASAQDCGASGLDSLMLSTAREELAKKGMKCLEIDKETRNRTPELEASLQDLERDYSVLMRTTSRDDVGLASMRKLASITGASAVLMQSVRVKLGDRGGRADSGIQWQGTSSTTIKASLISLASGERLWAKEMFCWTLPSDDRCASALTDMYKDQQNKKGDDQ